MRLIPSAARFRCTDAKVACGFDGIGKVGRHSRFGRYLPQTGLSVFRSKTLPLPATHLKGIWQRKQATEGNQKKQRNGLQTKLNNDASSVSRSFFLPKFHCCRKHGADGKLRSFKKIRLPPVGRQYGSYQPASFQCRIHGR